MTSLSANTVKGFGELVTRLAPHIHFSFFPSLMRCLFLHESALSDDEYTLFTSSFAEIILPELPPEIDDGSEKLTVSKRVARAWLRGRYHDLPVTDLDQVRISLSPNLAYLTLFSPLRARSYACSPHARGKMRPLAKGRFLLSFVLSYMFAVEQSSTKISFSNKVRTCPPPSFVTVPSSLVENYPDSFPSMTVYGAGD